MVRSLPPFLSSVDLAHAPGALILAVLASGTSFSAPANADEVLPYRWSRISDAHGSSLEAPTALLRRRYDPLSLVFVGKDGVRITFETVTEPRPGFPGNDPQGDMALKRSDCTAWPPSYRVLKERLAAYSCVRDANVMYYAGRYSPSGSVILRAKYPKTRAAVWDGIITRMSASMRQVARRELKPS